MAQSIRVWDMPTRLFHWLLVLLFAFSWWSAENHQMDWHRLSGIAMLGLVLFRLFWGFIGSNTARFCVFLRSPSKVLAYARSNGPTLKRAGHNPIGGYSTVAMLLLIAAQIVSGLFATDTDGLESGHLSHLVSFDQGRLAAEFHELSFNLLLIVIGLHLAAILFYLLVRKRNLISPMISGSDEQLETSDGTLIPAGWLRFALAAIIAAALAWFTSKGLGT